MDGLIAQHQGVCGGCLGTISVGQRIKAASGGWEHVKCPDPLAATNPVCLVCFLTHPVGKCDY